MIALPLHELRTYYPWSSLPLQVQEIPIYDTHSSSQKHFGVLNHSLMERIQSNTIGLSWDPETPSLFGSIPVKSCTVSFERRVHEHIHAGGEMTYKELNSGGMKNRKLGGDVVTRFSRLRKTIPGQRFRVFSQHRFIATHSFGMLVSLARREIQAWRNSDDRRLCETPLLWRKCPTRRKYSNLSASTSLSQRFTAKHLRPLNRG